MVFISGNSSSAPLIGSKVIRDRASIGIRLEWRKSLDPCLDAKSDANRFRYETDRTSDGVKRYNLYLLHTWFDADHVIYFYHLLKQLPIPRNSTNCASALYVNVVLNIS